MFLDGEKIGEYLGRMVIIGQPVPYRDSAVFCQQFYVGVPEAPEFDSVKHSSEYPCCILHAFFMSELNFIAA